MKHLFATLLGMIFILAVPLSGHADDTQHSEIGIVSGINSDKRVLYVNNLPYQVSKDVKVTSSGKTYFDAMLLPNGTVIEFKWSMSRGDKIISALHVHEGMKDLPQ